MSRKIETVVIPSVAGMGRIETGNLGLAGFESQVLQDLPDEVVFEGAEYLIGHNVEQHAVPVERLDRGRYTDGTELRAMLYTVLCRLNLTPGVRLAMVIGLPTELVKERGVTVEEEMARWLIGEHHFCFNRREMMFEVVKIRCRDVAQPIGAWLDWGLTDEGKWRKDRSRLAPALIIDGGAKDFDLFAIENGQPNWLLTAGTALGMHKACELLADSIRHKYKINLGLHEADQLFQAWQEGQTPVTAVRGVPTNVGREVAQAFQTYTAFVLRFIDSKVKDAGNRFHIIHAGGTALALSSSVRRVYEHAEVPPYPNLTIARGLGKLAWSGWGSDDGLEKIGWDPGNGFQKAVWIHE